MPASRFFLRDPPPPLPPPLPLSQAPPLVPPPRLARLAARADSAVAGDGASSLEVVPAA